MLERVKGIEPSYEAWEAAVLPLNYTRRLGCSLPRGAPDHTPTARRCQALTTALARFAVLPSSPQVNFSKASARIGRPMK